jgi:hypothetical protein
MPTEKTKKIKDKAICNSIDANSAKPLIKIKFNLSIDNLRPFMEGSRSTRSILKKSQLTFSPGENEK